MRDRRSRMKKSQVGMDRQTGHCYGRVGCVSAFVDTRSIGTVLCTLKKKRGESENGARAKNKIIHQLSAKSVG